MGGTPGEENSYPPSTDSIGPKVVQSFVQANTLVIHWDEVLEASQDIEINFEPDLWTDPSYVTAADSMTIMGNTTPEINSLFLLTIAGVSDCFGNSTETSFEMANTAVPGPGDLLINEIMFDPPPGGFDFIEVQNVSDKIFDLKDFSLGRWTIERSSIKPMSEIHSLMKPGEILAFTESPEFIHEQFPTSLNHTVLETKIPVLPNEEGSLLLISDSLLIDSLSYSSDWHFELLTRKEGVSLERLSLINDTNDSENWTSASYQSGYGTPGGINSHFSPADFSAGIRINPSLIRYDLGGLSASSRIDINPGKGSWYVSVYIYSTLGHQIKKLAEGQWAGPQSTFFWDGTTERGTKARPGIYIVLTESINSEGAKKVMRGKIYVGSPLD